MNGAYFDNPWLSLGIGLLSRPTLGQGLLTGVNLAQQSQQQGILNNLAQQRLQAAQRQNQLAQGDQATMGLLGGMMGAQQASGIPWSHQDIQNSILQGPPSNLSNQIVNSYMNPQQANPVTVAPGAALVDPTTGKPIFTNPKPKEDTADVQNYKFAKSNGYRGSYIQFKKDIAKAGASNINVGTNPNDAGRIALMVQARNDIAGARSLLFPNGKYDRGLAFKSDLPGMAGLPGNTKAREVYSKLQNAVAAKLRIETGAQANPSEIENIMRRFWPSYLDTPASAKDKLDRLDQFFAGGLSYTKGYNMPGAPEVGTVEDGFKFNGGDPANPNNWSPAQ